MTANIQALNKFTAGTCLTLLMALAAPGQEHPIPTAPKKSYEPASVRALPGLQCRLYAEGSDPSKGLTVFTDDDGYARFHAVRLSANEPVQRLTLDCKDSEARPSTFSVDLTSDETFEPRPLDITKERGTDRPALTGDPLSYTQAELVQAGYGLRPDPEDSDAYSRWVASATQPGRMLEKLPNTPYSHTVIKKTAPAWTGSVLGGSPKYISVEGKFNVPKAIPGGDETTGTEESIWNGLGGYNTGSGLIQAGVNILTTPLTAAYGTWREFCCGPGGNSNGYGGTFVPNPGDEIYDQNWYCDAKGNANINGGYGCSFVHDLNTGAILNCIAPSGSPCWSAKVHAGMTLGVNAEFIIENQTGQCCKPATQFTDFSSLVTFTGAAYSSKTGKFSQTISSDSLVYLLTDYTTSTSHMNVSLGTTNETYFSMSQFLEIGGQALYAVSVKCGNGVGCNAESLAVGPNANGSNIGDGWVLGTSFNSEDDFYVYRWVSGAWVQQTGIAGVMIAVSPGGYPWVVDHLGKIHYFNGSTWNLAPGNGCATAIGVGPNGYGLSYGDPWIIGCDGGYHSDASIYRLEGTKWVKKTGRALKIAVSPDLGYPWVVNAVGNIYFWNGSSFSAIAGCATSIGVGPLSAGIFFGDAFGDAWITGCTAEGNGYGIYQLQHGSWVKIPGSAVEIAVSPDLGVPWIVNSLQQIFQ